MPLPRPPDGGSRYPAEFLQQIAHEILVDASLSPERRRGKDGRPKIRLRCLFHQERTPSADYYPDDGWYYCHGACAQSFSIPEVAEALDMEMPPGKDRGHFTGHVVRSAHHHSGFGEPDAVYTYRFPDGSISHYKLRWGSGKKKEIRYQSPTFEWSKPGFIWPVYGDQVPPGCNVVICEGEKAVQRIIKAAETFDNSLVVAMTMGNSEDMADTPNQDILIARLRELAPKHVLVWQDNDQAGSRWGRSLYIRLKAAGFQVAKVQVSTLNLEPADGPDDFIARGGTLLEIFSRYFISLTDVGVEKILEEVPLIEGERFLFPYTRQLMPITKENMGVLWMQLYGRPIPTGMKEPLADAMRSRAVSAPWHIAWRRWHDRRNTCFIWRPDERGKTFEVSASGVHLSEDPPSTLVMLPHGTPDYSTEVDTHGIRADLDRLGHTFGLNDDELDLLEGWLLCAFIGLQTPVLLFKGEAGSGKTTLARALMAILEPTCPHMRLGSSRGGQVDERALTNTLRESVGVVMDNVGALSHDAEDTLCQIVTGYSVSQRRLYAESVERISVKRAVIMTTTSWEVRKGDLASRLLTLKVAIGGKYLPERMVMEAIDALIPKIRGYLFNRAALFFQRKQTYSPNGSKIRIADLGYVLEVLGFDVEHLNEIIQRYRREVLTESDMCVEGLVDFFFDHRWQGRPQSGDWFETTTREIWAHLREFGWDQAPQSPGLARWLREHNPIWSDFGFQIEYRRKTNFRGWKFTCLKPPRPDSTSTE